MTRLLSDLEELVGVLRKSHENFVPAGHLETEIAKRFGVGTLIIKRVKQELDNYNLLKPDQKDFRVWTFPEVFKAFRDEEEEKYLNSVIE
jgi:hypothetical protein